MTDVASIDRNTWEALTKYLDQVQETAEEIIKRFQLDAATTKLRTAYYRKVFVLHNIQGFDIIIFLDGSAVIYHPSRVDCYVMQMKRLLRLYVEQGNNMSYTIKSVETALACAETLEEFFRLLELQ
ncbi:MAG: hypothetical protein QXQ68_08550 [Candidatus Nitrosocaldaceae archaeon]